MLTPGADGYRLNREEKRRKEMVGTERKRDVLGKVLRGERWASSRFATMGSRSDYPARTYVSRVRVTLNRGTGA